MRNLGVKGLNNQNVHLFFTDMDVNGDGVITQHEVQM